MMNLLRHHSAFWSKLGFCYDPPRLNDAGKPIVFFDDFDRFAGFHRDFSAAGVKLHSSILFSGWIGVGCYDYTLTDQVLDALFKDNPDIYYIPRIKLNVPLDWGKENPEDVCVYYEGPREREAIRELVGTEKHDILGYDSPTGYYTAGGWQDDRPNVGGLISNQSFSSLKWHEDAGEMLRRLIAHLEHGPYGERIAGYHIAYGVSGETCLWGRFGKNTMGDYGISHRLAFFDWGIKRYGSIDALRQAWQQPELCRENAEPPPPQRRQHCSESCRDFFRADDCICVDYECFMSEINVDAIEYFGKLVKKHTNGKPVGCFYGYFLECFNAAYTGWLGYERILNSPHIDFIAAPKSYYRNLPGEPGGELAPAQSVNRKKLWMDELDIRTHLNVADQFAQGKNMAETRTLMWREFAKNLAHGSNFWWMDLGGGWFDSPEILREVAAIEKTAMLLREKPGKSVADILLVVDEESCLYYVASRTLHSSLMQDMIRNANLCGTPTDTYRLRDLETLDLAQYKLIVFLNTFKLQPGQWQRIASRIPSTAVLLWNYAPGILYPDFALSNVTNIIGMTVRERTQLAALQLLPEPGEFLQGTEPMRARTDADIDYPLLEIVPSENVRVLARYEDGAVAMAMRNNVIYSVLPFFRPEHLRRIAALAGCHLYAPVDCTVYADSRFIAVFPKNELREQKIEFVAQTTLRSAITGQKENNVKSISLNLSAKGAEFFIIEQKSQLQKEKGL